MDREPLSTAVRGEFEIAEERPSAGTAVFSLRGDADIYAAPMLRERLTTAIESGTSTLVLDLSQVEFVDSMAISVFLDARKRVRSEGGDVRLVIPREDIRRIFEITLLDRIFRIDRTRDDALLAIASATG